MLKQKLLFWKWDLNSRLISTWYNHFCDLVGTTILFAQETSSTWGICGFFYFLYTCLSCQWQDRVNSSKSGVIESGSIFVVCIVVLLYSFSYCQTLHCSITLIMNQYWYPVSPRSFISDEIWSYIFVIKTKNFKYYFSRDSFQLLSLALWCARTYFFIWVFKLTQTLELSVMYVPLQYTEEQSSFHVSTSFNFPSLQFSIFEGSHTHTHTRQHVSLHWLCEGEGVIQWVCWFLHFLFKKSVQTILSCSHLTTDTLNCTYNDHDDDAQDMRVFRLSSPIRVCIFS